MNIVFHRQQVSKAEHELNTMLEKLVELAKKLSLRLRVIDSIKTRQDFDIKEVADIQETLNELEEQLAVTEELVQVVLTTPLDVELEEDKAKTEVPPREPPREEPFIQEPAKNEVVIEEAPQEAFIEEEVDVDEGKTEQQIKLEIVKMMARLYEQGKRPEDDDEFVQKLANYRKKFETENSE